MPNNKIEAYIWPEVINFRCDGINSRLTPVTPRIPKESAFRLLFEIGFTDFEDGIRIKFYHLLKGALVISDIIVGHIRILQK
jgi:hypothetical protein